MHKTVKAACLDFLLVKEYFKTIIYLVIVTVIFAVSTKSISSGIVTAMSILAMRVVSLPFESEERTEINKFYGAIPLLETQRVYGRYFFTILIGVFGAVLSLAIQVIVFIGIGIKITITESVTGFLIGLFIYLFSVALQVPFFYRFGVIKGRLAVVFPIIGLGAFYYFSGKLVNWGITPSTAMISILDNSIVVGLILLIFIIVLLIISMQVTIKTCISRK